MAEGRSTYCRAANDWYVEPPWVTEKLLDVVDFSDGAYDPACGIGTIPDVLEARGLPTTGSDIIDRARGRFRVRDFLTHAMSKPTWPGIICNPPYLAAEPFIERALEETLPGGRVAMLLPLKFAASQGRYPLFTRPEMEWLIVLSKRPSIPPGEFLAEHGEAARRGGTIDFAWFVFRAGKRTLGVSTSWLR